MDSANMILDEMASVTDQGGSAPQALAFATGLVELARGDAGEAVARLHQAAQLGPGTGGLALRYATGRACLEAGKLAEAVEIFEGLIEEYVFERLFEGVKGVKLHYYLGRSYEESQWFDRAIEQYELFLDIWHDADPGLVVVDDARVRLSRLRAGDS